MKKVLKVKKNRATWLGKSGVVITHHLDSYPLGLRVTVTQLDGEKTAEVKLIRGDGQKQGFEMRSNRCVSLEAVDATVAEFAA